MDTLVRLVESFPTHFESSQTELWLESYGLFRIVHNLEGSAIARVYIPIADVCLGMHCGALS